MILWYNAIIVPFVRFLFIEINKNMGGKMKYLASSLLVLVLSFISISLSAGTIFFRDGSKLSDVKIISIADGEIVLEKSSIRKSYSLRLFKAYYDADIKTGSDSSPDKYIDYKVSVFSIKMPKKGFSSSGKPQFAEIQYGISKKPGKATKLKVPYFYLYVLAERKYDDENRKMYSFYFPSAAEPKSNSYDVASILSQVMDYGRHEINIKQAGARDKLMGQTVRLALRSIGDRKVLAWHLEIWGNSDKVYEKSVIEEPTAGVGEHWWKRYQ